MGINPIVKDKDRVAWENYSNFGEDAKWYEEGREYQMMLGVDDLDNRPQVKTDDPNLHLTSGVANYIYDFERDTTGKGVISPKADWYLPIWQVSLLTTAIRTESILPLRERTKPLFSSDFSYYSPNNGEPESCE